MRTLMKSFLLVLAFVLSSHAMAGGLISKSVSANVAEIGSLSTGDSKFLIVDAQLSEKGSIEKLAKNTGVGSQGSDQVVERSMQGGCSVGCSTGCSVGCSVNCSMGCR